MPPRLRLFWLALTAALLLIPGLALYRELSRRPDIWWTPLPLALSLSESQDRVEIYVQGKPLGALLEAQQLSVTDKVGSRTLGADQIRLRFNNWDRIRAARLPLLLVYAASSGGGLVLLLLIAASRLAYRNEGPSIAA
ncbi:MAG: hypothetical protein OEY20_15785 [Gemmatimonadota bacterium]|nr:hypothetical protein [Gemmatimonadota bacterium]